MRWPAAGIEEGSSALAEAGPARRGGDFRSPRKPAGPAFRQGQTTPESPAAARIPLLPRKVPAQIEAAGRVHNAGTVGEFQATYIFDQEGKAAIPFWNAVLKPKINDAVAVPMCSICQITVVEIGDGERNDSKIGIIAFDEGLVAKVDA